MLRALRIKDLAIIDELDLEFTMGFTVFSGETGAGKSIIVDALDLITGGRGSSDIVRDGCDETVIEGIFDSINKDLHKEKLRKYGIDDNGNELLVKRSISRSGRNRLFINGSLSTLSVLNDVCSELIDIHGQHEHQTLLRKESHSGYLDAFGKLTDLRMRVADRYAVLNDLQKHLNKLTEEINLKKEREELIRFQLSEIKGASLKPGEDVELEGEQVILSNSQNLSSLSHDAYGILYENDDSAITLMRKAENLLSEIAGIDPCMNEAADMVSSSKVNIKEAADIIRRFMDKIRHDPERLERVNERIYFIDRLKKKYVRTIEDILLLQETLEKDLTSIGSLDHDVTVLMREIEKVHNEVRTLADELSELRRSAAVRFESDVMSELSNLSMDKIKFVVKFEPVPLSQDGVDAVEFLIANMNEEPKQLTKVASGGELSRILLAIKSRLNSTDSVPTLIFDEVDAGIGGRVAEEVGRRLKSLSKDNQLFCVTHLPQIAAMADNNYHVEKVFTGDRVVTRVRRLDRMERIYEISRMLGGSDQNETAFKYAEEMLDRVEKGNEKETAKYKRCSQH